MTIRTVTTTTTIRRCDFRGGCDDEHGDARTIAFGIDGKAWEAEFCADDELALALDIDEFLKAARLVKAATPARPERYRPVASRRRSAAIRAWALGQGLSVSDRGRIPAYVAARYDAEHPAGQR